jgi:hypothetical protein
MVPIAKVLCVVSNEGLSYAPLLPKGLKINIQEYNRIRIVEVV